ncbi:hypothetical protein ZIOFF_013932 [Zingiber officinale]|uniref:Uncharacterized protein n=1 Tax=Zingiber officinale TaxID=94328 RepID=A0A8J5LL85_ZINOF|nr:hypothetical protein ZIOFF_013932 [Zingiber officinale]
MPTTSALGTGPLEVRFNKVIESLVDQIDLSEEEAEVCLKLLLNEANEALIRAFSKRGNVDNSVKCNCADLFQRLFRFHDSMDAYAEQRAMAAFVLAVVVDGHRRRQEACIQANFLNVSLKHLQIANPSDGQTEPLLLHGFVYVWARKALGRFSISTNHSSTSVWQVRASAIFALGTLIDVASITFDGHRVDEDFENNEKLKSELNIIKNLLQLAVDGSPLVRAEVVVVSALNLISQLRMNCKHIYEKELVIHYISTKKPHPRCPVAGCLKILQVGRVVCDALLTIEIDEMRLASATNIMSTMVEDFYRS